MVQIATRNTPNQLDAGEVQHFLTYAAPPRGDVAEALANLGAMLPCFTNLAAHRALHQAEWAAFASSPRAEECVPRCWSETDTSPVREAFRELLVVQAARPDRLVAQAERVVLSVLGAGLLHKDEPDLGDLIAKEVDANTPVLLCALPGYDASHYIERLAEGRALRSIAIGSAEGFAQAEQAIAAAARTGDWVLLKVC